MRRYLYLSTAVAGVMMMSGNANAQCVTSQDCTTLGYTQTSCPDGKGLKCPFGNKWACFSSEITPAQCTELGFTYSCTGTNQTGGASKACNGKYNYCTCAEGYEWKSGSCQQKAPDYAGCAIGTLFYSDNTCSSNKVSGKTILGVVIMEKTTSQMGWIMAIKPIQTGIMWGGDGTDIPGLPNYSSTPSDVQASCTNTTTITNYGTSSTYPAAWAAKNYKPSGTPSGKTWCLPSGGLLKNSLNNQTNFDRINAGITTAGGKKIGFGPSYDSEFVWSSSEHDTIDAWFFYASTSGSFTMDYGDKYSYGGSTSVRPVLAF